MEEANIKFTFDDKDDKREINFSCHGVRILDMLRCQAILIDEISKKSEDGMFKIINDMAVTIEKGLTKEGEKNVETK